MKTFISAILAISFVMGSSLALAKGQTRPGAEKRKQCSEQATEVAHRLSAQFANVDQNNDGQLTKSEIANQAVGKDCFSHIDRNRDGQLSTTELARFA